jgi:hypothetical protein
MYTSPTSFKNLVDELAAVVGTKELARLLVHVELTLSLAEHLQMDSEPLSVGWVLLSRMPLNHPLLNKLSPIQRRMRANAALIVPLSSRFGWESALIRYAKDIPDHIRLYQILPTRLDEQIINVCRKDPCPDPIREAKYEAMLAERLPYHERPVRETTVNETYKVHVKAADGQMKYGQVTVTDAMQQSAGAQHQWFDSPRPRTVITVSMNDLLPTAEFLDNSEARSGGHPHWVHDLRQIRFRRLVTADGAKILETENTQSLQLEGAIHLPGMVSAGKTTLAKLIVAHCIRLKLDARITLVVGDSHTAIETAHQVNNWFCDDPNGEAVVAVPILGASQRETHLKRLLASREYARSLEAKRPHWGERWLMPICPLASQIKWEGEGGADINIPAGNEPCYGLMDQPRRPKTKGKMHICPLAHDCPSKQMYRDMQNAQLWVTTPGALAQATLPLHLDARIGKMGDLIYEQSDLVILDEVETIMDWVDRIFAERIELTNGQDGLLDRLDPQISQYWTINRVLPQDSRRWLMAAREAPKALSGVLTAVANPNQDRMVKKWIGHHYFAPNQLAYRLARRLAGLKEWDNADTPLAERYKNDAETKAIYSIFYELLNSPIDPLRRQIPPTPGDVDQVGELARLMQAINNLADDVADEEIFTQSRSWIERWYPDIEARLAALKQKLKQSANPFDKIYLEEQFDRSLDELAQRLQFMLTVALLDRHMHIFLQEWHNKPENLDAEQPFSRIPKGMRNILPLPLTGQQYGFAIDSSGNIQDNRSSNRLSLFMHTNIGRSYLLDFHRLREDLEGSPGPHVLALSGTSYLPDSTPFHIPLQPSGVLIAPRQTELAVQNSRFIWKHFVDRHGKPIKISGEQDKEHKLRVLMIAMLEHGGMPGGFIGQTLSWLEKQGTAYPEQWADRERVLLLTNSYTQARAIAQALRDGWREAAGTIYHLKRGKGDEDYEAETGAEEQGTLRRIDIEQFASTGGRVLVAPMQSIGRGFNILNDQRKAAFGAVFFLTRPMNRPHDMEAIAQELNRYALEWANDPSFSAWADDTLYRRALNAREAAMELRRLIEHRHSYSHLYDNEELRLYPRRDLAASTAGRIVQAVGRLLRGGVPFHAYFVDAAWSPDLAKTGDNNRIEDEKTSLLTALINILADYADQDEIGRHLYGGLSEALITTENRDNN